MSPDEKTCPNCAETVKAAAVKCKHCGSELPPPPAADVPEKKKASCGQMLGCFGVLMLVGVISAIFNADYSGSNNNIAETDDVQVNETDEKAALPAKPIEKSEPAETKVIQQPGSPVVAAAATSAGLGELCYVGVNSSLPTGVTVGEFLARGKQRGYFRNTLITGDTVRFRSPQNSGALKVITLSFRRTGPTPGCNARYSATPSSGKINFETLNNANLYVLLAMLEGMAFSDDVGPLSN